MPKLVSFVNNPETYGVRMVMPQPRQGAFWDVFEVDQHDFNPDHPTMHIRVSRVSRQKFGPSCELHRNDLLLHLESGVVARVVQRVDPTRARVEAWCLPDGGTPELKKRAFDWWNQKQALGRWVVWGQCYGPQDKLPFEEAEEVKIGAHLPEHLQKAAMEARFDLFKHPEREPWVGHKRVRMSKKQRRKLTRQLRRLAKSEWSFLPGADSGDEQVRTLADITDEQIDRNTFFRKKLKHGEIKYWVSKLSERAKERIRKQGGEVNS